MADEDEDSWELTLQMDTSSSNAIEYDMTPRPQEHRPLLRTRDIPVSRRSATLFDDVQAALDDKNESLVVIRRRTVPDVEREKRNAEGTKRVSKPPSSEETDQPVSKREPRSSYKRPATEGNVKRKAPLISERATDKEPPKIASREIECAAPPVELELEPLAKTVMYPNQNKSWVVARFGEIEMEKLYGSLQSSRRPWLDEYDPFARGFPWVASPHTGVRSNYLFDPSFIYEVCAAERKGEMYYINLFFQKRFYTSQAPQHTHKSPSSLAQSWKDFVSVFAEDPNQYRAKVERAKLRFLVRTVIGAAMQVHWLSIRDVKVCTVPIAYHCPNCYSDSVRIDIADADQAQVTSELQNAHFAHQQRLDLSIVKSVSTPTSIAMEMKRFDGLLNQARATNADINATVHQSARDIASLQSGQLRLSRLYTTIEARARAVDTIELNGNVSQLCADVAHLRSELARLSKAERLAHEKHEIVVRDIANLHNNLF